MEMLSSWKRASEHWYSNHESNHHRYHLIRNEIMIIMCIFLLKRDFAPNTSHTQSLNHLTNDFIQTREKLHRLISTRKTD